MISCLYKGNVWHQRLKPKNHQFKYKLTWFYLDLDEIETLNNKNLKSKFLSFEKFSLLFRFCKKDYCKDNDLSLKEDAIKRLYLSKGISLNPKHVSVRILTQVRVLNFVFNPVSFYYFYDKNDKQLIAIMSEINNTPWGERHIYSFNQHELKNNKITFRKTFHVSPFMPMEQSYEWEFNTGEGAINISMDSNDDEYGKIFNAGMHLEKIELSNKALLKTYFMNPLNTLKTISAIYYHALLLKIKGIPFYEHPKYKKKQYAS
jgi:uncharacterized protein